MLTSIGGETQERAIFALQWHVALVCVIYDTAINSERYCKQHVRT
ncbi:hypothetical protein VTO7225_03563 [Vibrio toranzoniae]|nr:hypothetical protein VTO7225_03563 [Vibrio toranzoniae]